MQTFKRGAAALTVLLATACASTAPVRDFANASHKTMGDAGAVSATWVRACDLNRVYIVAAPPDYCDVKKDDKPAARQAAKANGDAAAVVDAYTVALAGLASLDPHGTADAAKAFAAEAVSIGEFSTDENSAIKRLASAIASVATDAWRDEEVWKHMKNTDNDVVIVTAAISKNITGGYTTQLRDTSQAMQQHVDRFTANALDKEWSYLCRDESQQDPHEPKNCDGITAGLAWQAWHRNYLDDGQWVKTQQRQATILAKRVAEVGQTHHWLSTHAGDIDTKELASHIYAIAEATPLAAKIQETNP